ncbi:MAG: proline iminopeptidase-family hydrolase [Marmoricola sp.]
MSPTQPVEPRTGTVEFRGHQTWYRITGDLQSGSRPPLVVLHGGPGAAHNYCLSMAELSADGRAVVHYDQIGCGNSTHLPDADPDFWSVELFIDELTNLVEHLGISTGFHLLGQSWGGMLGPEFVLARPEGVLSLTICDSPASMGLWLQAAGQLRAELPRDVQEVLSHHEEEGTTDDPAYEKAMEVFYARHVCRVQPLPPDVAASFAQIDADPTVYHTMNGPSEFHVVGTLKDWTVVDRVAGILVPTLVVSGRYDEAMPLTWAPFVDRIPDVRSHVFAESSHMPHVEETTAFLDVVGSFLREQDPPMPNPLTRRG